MSTAVLITLIICGTLFALVALILIAALIVSHKTRKDVSNFQKDFFKGDRW